MPTLQFTDINFLAGVHREKIFFDLVILCTITHIIRSIYEILKHRNILKPDKLTFAIVFIYSKIRHPMYAGFILWLIGFPIIFGAFFHQYFHLSLLRMSYFGDI
jgi:protein-S-isoprenylcysteine O-methyltransferase Ste14